MFPFFRKPDPPTQTKSIRLAAKPETDETFEIGKRMADTGEYRNRYDYDQHKILLNALNAWRVNPMARRAIELTTQFVIGHGLEITSPDNKAAEFITAWRTHRANLIDQQLPEWADESWRSGNLILLGSVDDAGMTYFRPIPAELIAEFKSYANDPYRLKRITLSDLEKRTYPAYKSGARQRAFVMHFPFNRPAGGTMGESDLAPVLRWISLYTDWLIDRAATNKYVKPSFVVYKPFDNQAKKQEFANSVKPPAPGSTTVADPDEKWEAINPHIGAIDAASDGLALKKMIATGLGFPLHYFAEPESSTRTTAEAAGTPTYRRLQQRQNWFVHTIETIIRTALEVRATFAGDIDPQAKIEITAPDISERDNTQMALAASRIATALQPYYEVVGGQEVVNMIYRFAGEKKTPKVIPGQLPLPFTPKGSGDSDPEDTAGQKETEIENAN